MSINEALALQPLAHNGIDAARASKALAMAEQLHNEHDEGVTYDHDSAGTAHFRLYFPNAKRVTVRVNEQDCVLTQDKDTGLWTGTVQRDVGLSYLFLYVDGHDILSPYIPLTFGFSRAMHYVDIPPPASHPASNEKDDDETPITSDSCNYLMRHEPSSMHRGVVVHDYFVCTVSERIEKLLLYLPPSYFTPGGQSRRYPVLYLLHGHGENENGWVYNGKVNIIADNLIADEAVTEMIIVMGDGMLLRKNTSSTDTSAFCDAMINDIIPHIDNRYRTKAERTARAVAGLSMGSMQSSRMAILYPDMFSAVGIFSGFVQPLTDRLYSKDDYMGVLRKDPARFTQAMTTIFRCIGKDDIFMSYFVKDDALLAELNIPHIRTMYPGGHRWPVWRRAIADFMHMIFKE